MTNDRTEGINSGSIGAALSLKGPCRDVATVVFTPEQIEKHVRSLLVVATQVYPQIQPLLSSSVSIIKQLQEEAKEPVLLNPEVAIGIRDESVSEFNRRIQKNRVKHV